MPTNKLLRENLSLCRLRNLRRPNWIPIRRFQVGHQKKVSKSKLSARLFLRHTGLGEKVRKRRSMLWLWRWYQIWQVHGRWGRCLTSWRWAPTEELVDKCSQENQKIKVWVKTPTEDSKWRACKRFAWMNLHGHKNYLIIKDPTQVDTLDQLKVLKLGTKAFIILKL